MRGLSLVAASRGYSSLQCAGFSLQWLLLLQSTGSRLKGSSSCGTQAQQLWRMGLVAPRHVGYSRTRDQTCVPCIGRQILFFFLIYGCVGSSFLCEGFLQLWQAGATLHHGAQASRHRGLSCCGAQAPDAQAQQLWLTGPAAPRHVGSSQTRARTRVPCTGRRTPNHRATREAPAGRFLTTVPPGKSPNIIY